MACCRAPRARALLHVAIGCACLFASHARQALAQPCTVSGKCTDSSGKVWDLSPIGAEQTTSPVKPDDTWNTYSLQIYGNLDPVPPACLNAGRLGTNAAVYNIDPSSNDCSQIGPDMNAPLTQPTLTTSSAGLVFTYKYLDDTTGQNSLVLTLACGSDAGKPGPVTAVDQGGGWIYTSTWPTKYACKDGQKPGDAFDNDIAAAGTFGVVVLVLFFVGGAMYAGGGWFYNHRTKGYGGSEALPHIEFWRTIPGLVADGVTFTRQTVSAKMQGGEAGGAQHTATASEAEASGDEPTPTSGKKKKKPKKQKGKSEYTSLVDEGGEEEAKE